MRRLAITGRLLRLLLLCAGTVLHSAWQPSAASGQSSQHDGGFWVGFGFAASRARVDCNCGPLSVEGIGAYTHAGGSVNQRLIVGGELAFWTDDYSPKYEPREMGSTSGSSLMALAHYYPFSRNAFFVTAGLGLVDTTVVPLLEHGERLESYGAALKVGVGYEIRLRRNFKLRPELVHHRSIAEEVEEAGVTVDRRLKPGFSALLLGFTWR